LRGEREAFQSKKEAERLEKASYKSKPLWVALKEKIMSGSKS